MIRSENRRKRPKFEKFPVKFPVSREFAPETGSPLTGSSARQSGLRGFISPLGRIADIPVGYAGRSQSLVGNFPYFGPCGAGFGRRSLVAFFQFPFRRGGDRFDCRQRPVRRGPLESQADAGTKSTASVDSLADIRCVSWAGRLSLVGRLFQAIASFERLGEPATTAPDGVPRP